MTFEWRDVGQHPPVPLCVHRIDRSLWSMFARHHYLSADINSSAQCYGGFVGEDLVAFMAYIHFPHPRVKDIKIGHRTVVLPDFQGLGISGRMAEVIGQLLHDQGYRYRRVIAHPAVISYCSRSPRWRENKRSGGRVPDRPSGAPWNVAGNRTPVKRIIDPRVLNTRSFEYVPVRPR
jgi:GNAT superfamily N-acetyltransferase